MPETSIIIRTFNEEKHLGNLLEAIGKQKYKNHEVIVVDSGSTDRTLEIARAAGVRLLQIESRNFTFGHSLNVGCNAAQGTYLVFASAHVLPRDHDWLGRLTAPFADPTVAMVYGRQMGNESSKFSERKDLARLFGSGPANTHAPLTYANNANAAIRKELWEEIHFDEYLFGLEDIAWAREVVARGYRVHYEPGAAVYHLHEEAWPQVFNRYRREAIAAVRIGLPQPSQASTHWFSFLWRLATDVGASFPYWSLARLEEILRFRYYQWKGSRIGWRQGRDLHAKIDAQAAFFDTGNAVVSITKQHYAERIEAPIPELAPGDILIKVSYVGVCRTDLEILDRTLGYYRDGTAHYPIVPGHEFSGTIARIGSNNRYQERFKVGEAVVGECILSRDPEHRIEVGVINHNGAYGSYVSIPGNRVHKIPPGLDSKAAALTEPLAVVLRALRRIEHRLGQGTRVAVIGAGPVGNLATQALTLQGCRVTVFDRNEKRLTYLKDAAECATELGGLNQFDVIVEVTGSREVLNRVLCESRFDSTLLLLGFPYGVIPYDFEDIPGNEKMIVGSVGGDTPDFKAALTLLPKLSMKPFTETVLPLAEFTKAWELHRTGEHLKILLQP